MVMSGADTSTNYDIRIPARTYLLFLLRVRISFYQTLLLFPILQAAHLNVKLLCLAIQPEYVVHLSDMDSETNEGGDVMY